jgi:hypothetical protein
MMVAFSFCAGSTARATGFTLGDAANYIIIYQGGSSGAQLSINNFGTTDIWIGNIGIAGTGKLAATGPGTLNGKHQFCRCEHRPSQHQQHDD